MPEIKTEKKSLRYDFKARETHEMSMQLAQKTIEGVEIENESKAVQSQYTSRLKVVKSEVGKLSRQIQDGWELREIECDIEYHKPAKGKKTITRKDNMHEWVEPMESWEWTLFNQPEDEDDAVQEAEVVVEDNGPKLLEN